MDILRVYCAIQVNRPRLPVVLLVGLSVLLFVSIASTVTVLYSASPISPRSFESKNCCTITIYASGFSK